MYCEMISTFKLVDICTTSHSYLCVYTVRTFKIYSLLHCIRMFFPVRSFKGTWSRLPAACIMDMVKTEITETNSVMHDGSLGVQMPQDGKTPRCSKPATFTGVYNAECVPSDRRGWQEEIQRLIIQQAVDNRGVLRGQR